MTLRRVVHLFDTTGENESRFLKEARSTLRARIAEEVVLVCRWAEGLPVDSPIEEGIRVVRVRRSFGVRWRNPALGVLRYRDLQRRFVELTLALRPLLVHCHSLVPLPAATAASRALRCPVLYDAHELETEVNGVRGIRQQFDRWTEARFIRQASAVLCVSEAIADWYSGRYAITRPFVVQNVPDFQAGAVPGRTGRLRRRLNLGDRARIFLYQGGLFPGRRIEQLLRVFATLPIDQHLVLMGYGALEPEVRRVSERCSNIHFVPAVAPDELLEHTADADVGIVGVEDVCLSYRLSLPNKFFEYLAAGVPALMPDYPEMARMASVLNCARTVGESDEEWRAMILGLSDATLATLRAHAESARLHVGWSNEEPHLFAAYAACGLVRPEASA